MIYLPNSNICDYSICEPFNHAPQHVKSYYTARAMASKLLEVESFTVDYDKGISHLQGCLVQYPATYVEKYGIYGRSFPAMYQQ